MKARIRRDPDSALLLSVEDLQAYLAVGRATAVKIGEESGARRKIGRRVLYDRRKIVAYVDNLEE